MLDFAPWTEVTARAYGDLATSTCNCLGDMGRLGSVALACTYEEEGSVTL